MNNPLLLHNFDTYRETIPFKSISPSNIEEAIVFGIKEEKTVLQSENHQADFCAAVEKEPTEDISDKLYKELLRYLYLLHILSHPFKVAR